MMHGLAWRRDPPSPAQGARREAAGSGELAHGGKQRGAGSGGSHEPPCWSHYSAASGCAGCALAHGPPSAHQRSKWRTGSLWRLRRPDPSLPASPPPRVPALAFTLLAQAPMVCCAAKRGSRRCEKWGAPPAIWGAVCGAAVCGVADGVQGPE